MPFMRKLDGNLALIFGGTSGSGETIAILYAKEGTQTQSTGVNIRSDGTSHSLILKEHESDIFRAAFGT